MAAVLDRGRLLRELAGYAIAFGAVVAALAITRVTWPLFARTPYLLLFAATFLGARYGNEIGALLAILAAAFGTSLAVPADSVLVDEPAVLLFVGGSVLINRIVIGRKRADEALRKSEAQFRAAWDNSTFGAALLTRRGLVERINPAMERTLGYPSEAWAGVSFGYFSHPDDQIEERARFAAFIDGSDEWYHREQRYRRADGGIIWCRVTMSATHDGAGGPRTGALMVIEDVTRRRRAEDDILSRDARYRALFERVPIGLFECDLDGRILMMNGALQALLGTDGAALVGGGVADFIGDLDARSSVQAALAAGGSVRQLRTVLQRKDGGRITAILDVRPVRTADGLVEYFDGTVEEP